MGDVAQRLTRRTTDPEDASSNLADPHEKMTTRCPRSSNSPPCSVHGHRCRGSVTTTQARAGLFPNSRRFRRPVLPPPARQHLPCPPAFCRRAGLWAPELRVRRWAARPSSEADDHTRVESKRVDGDSGRLSGGRMWRSSSGRAVGRGRGAAGAGRRRPRCLGGRVHFGRCRRPWSARTRGTSRRGRGARRDAGFVWRPFPAV